MRYYGLLLKTNDKQILDTKKINLKDYGYCSAVASLNGYVYQFLPKDINFLIYREEEKKLLAVFSYDEQLMSFDSAMENLSETLGSAFDYKGLASEPNEISMSEYIDAIRECKRRQLMERWGSSLYDNAKLWLYEYIQRNDKKTLPYEFEEIMISDKKDKMLDIYDSSFKNELFNISNHSVETLDSGIMAHYILSANSEKATKDMISNLGSELYKAGRITSKRINYLSEINPNLYCRDNNVEEMIENNYGGMIVFYLREKLGCSKTLYGTTCQFINKCFKRYRNKCVFVFAYEKNNPGFSFYLIPQVRKNALFVELKEGKGGKKEAERYLRKLILNSENKEYVSYSKEFMKTLSQGEFTQTDVIDAFEKFEPWCMNKKMQGIYDYNLSDDFYLDRNEESISPYAKLHNLIGLEKVKKQIDNIIASDKVEKLRKQYQGDSYEVGSQHMIFAGNPGGAKTTVAKLFAGIAKDEGILESGVFVETGGMDLNFMLPPLIRDKFTAAKGGVLFIDEAYSLDSSSSIATLIQEMENHRDDVIVILAGYNADMERFLSYNDGLKSRIPHWIDFPDYSVDELTDIFKLMAKERNFTVEEDAVKEAKYIFKKAKCITNFGNGRYVRNVLDKAILNQASRLLSEKEDESKIKKSDLFTIKKSDITMLNDLPSDEPEIVEERKPGDAKAELEKMIGLKSAKEIIRKVVANAKLNKLCLDKGIKRENTSLHMVFTGNPGTAKTSVARLVAEIMKDEKVLDLGKFVEVGRADLIGDHVGQTAKLVKKKFQDAEGGVLFIDEAYSLVDEHKNSFGDEAISTIVQEMENRRDKVIVIFAGYPKPMKDFLDRNPGMKSRIAYHVNFEDYSKEELCDIAKLMLSKKHSTLTKEAMNKLEKTIDKVVGTEDFGNGRFVRKMIETAEMNLAERIAALSEDQIDEKLVTTFEACDIPDYDDMEVSKEDKKAFSLGFAC